MRRRSRRSASASERAHGGAQERRHPSDNRAVTEPAFRFRLERVRTLREGKKKLAQQQLAEAITLRSSSERELRTVDAHLEHARAEQLTASSEQRPVSATDLLARQAFIERVEAQRLLRAQELAQREAEVVDRDARLTSAASDHEMLNRLRERHRGEHDREAARRERNLLDEIAAVRAGRSTA
jgi:flagellar export protein FliJ